VFCKKIQYFSPVSEKSKFVSSSIKSFNRKSGWIYKLAVNQQIKPDVKQILGDYVTNIQQSSPLYILILVCWLLNIYHSIKFDYSIDLM